MSPADELVLKLAITFRKTTALGWGYYRPPVATVCCRSTPTVIWRFTMLSLTLCGHRTPGASD